MKETKQFEDLNVVRKRMGIIIAARLRKENKIKEATKIQDELSKKSGSWSGEKEIRKWREKR